MYISFKKFFGMLIYYLFRQHSLKHFCSSLHSSIAIELSTKGGKVYLLVVVANYFSHIRNFVFRQRGKRMRVDCRLNG